MSRYVTCGVGVLALIGCASAPAMTLRSGVDLNYVDHSVRPQDDLYRYLNGKWLDSFQLPPDKASYGSFTYVDDATQEQLRGIVDGLVHGQAQATQAGNADAEVRKIADLYQSFMDEARLEALGMKPLRTEFAAIDAIAGKGGIPTLITHLNRIDAVPPLKLVINHDSRNYMHYTASLPHSRLLHPALAL